MSIVHDTFCVYCQKDFGTPRKMGNHVLRQHPGTYAAAAIERHRTAERIDVGVALAIAIDQEEQMHNP